MKILLVEPAYYTQYPPLGLLKLSTLYKAEGHEVRFVRGLQLVTRFVPDEIQVTSLFTWAWRPVWEAVAFYKALFPRAKVTLGGIYATLMPDHARESGAHEVVTGLNKAAEDLMPDYELVPDWHRDRAASIVFTTRGCIRKCDFCAVPRLEGKPFQIRNTGRIGHLVHPDHKRVIFWDNNILGEKHWPEVFAELRELDLEADFNQGLDARLITEEIALELKNLRVPTIRLAYDFVQMRNSMDRAIRNLRRAGLNGHRLGHVNCYVLFNHRDTPDDLFTRVRDLLAWGVAAYPMRYQPLNGDYALNKDSWVGENWTVEELEMVAAARRVIGFGGAFPPYEGLVKKFANARNFEEAFGLRARADKERSIAPKRAKPATHGWELKEFAWDLVNMGRDHQFPFHALAPNS
ncbi:MAG: hypothetical protein QOF05_1070 [Sphingomonadales bacterium]|jgi:hypothetical protein|nr:hypothetical protein [Sphingomonadales bacterium]